MTHRLGLLSMWLVCAALVVLLRPWSGAAAPAAVEPPATLVATGRNLFVAKGCTGCHSHAAVGAPLADIGPNLSHYVPDTMSVRQWLRDPASLRPTTQMPNLHLSEAEINALIAFLQASAEP